MKYLSLSVLLAILCLARVFAQSTNENFPTPIQSNEISGVIDARDVGDARLTRHFYTFFADRGDMDLSVETANFDGDIDLFEATTLRPLSKVTVYNDGSSNTSSRSVYFRKREQVVLRVEGRTLTDDPARYRISFAGSFAAATDLPEPPADLEPKVVTKTSDEAVARVNSAGAIVEVSPPKTPTEEPKLEVETISRAPVEKTNPAPSPRVARSRNPRTSARRRSSPKTEKTEKRPAEENATSNQNIAAAPEEVTAATKSVNNNVSSRNRTRTRSSNSRQRSTPNSDTNAPIVATQPNPLETVRLIIQLKDGALFERSMSEVFNMKVDKGVITIITKNGKINRYSLLDVQKMTIE